MFKFQYKNLSRYFIILQKNYHNDKYYNNKNNKLIAISHNFDLWYFLFFLILISISFLRPTKAFEYSEQPIPAYDESNETDETIDIAASPLSFPNETIANESLNSNDETERNPSEVQKAVCTITAGEVRASAEAVTTKTLKGVCGSAELQLAFGNLETKIFKELEELKSILLQQQQQQANVIKNQQNSNCVCNENIKLTTQQSSPSPPVLSAPITLSATNKKSTKNANFNNIESKLKSLPAHHQQQLSASREKEISKFNNTMLADKDLKVFTYYWRLENFTKRIECDESLTIDSPRFAIKGKPLHLKAYFQHLHRDFLYIQLEYANTMTSLKKNSNNIILDMGLMGGVGNGNLFKAISSNNQILFKYKISILDQQNLRSSKDLVSQEFHNLENGFLIPNSALLNSPFIKNDTLLVQLFLYL